MINPPRYLYLLLAVILPALLGFAAFPDPTRPPGANEAPMTYVPGQALQVTAIFIYPKKRIAIISGQTTQIGDHIGEYTVSAINPYTVELMGAKNEVETLQLTTQVKQVVKKGL